MMTRLALILALGLSCTACAASIDNAAGRSYQLDPGTADYDSLHRATELCKTRGGVLKPRQDADLTELSDYSCVIAKGK